jgi:hypothetical protein
MLVGGAHNLISMTYFMYTLVYTIYLILIFLVKGINEQNKNKKKVLELRMSLII